MRDNRQILKVKYAPMKKIELHKITFIISAIFIIMPLYMNNAHADERFFPIQAIDTVKYSRDVAIDKMKDASFDQEIDTQVSNIAGTGATHIALGTPYDEEFVPFLTRWVKSARKHNLKVWFRGNLSGWEGWFDYSPITREEHTHSIALFIKKHPELFEDDDIFTSCPECENGDPDNPNKTGKVDGFREFLINENYQVRQSFFAIEKNVSTNYYSMNGDVAKRVMDKKTTDALGGVVTIDHYVKDADRMIKDIEALHNQSGGEIMLGEIGAPIPDIHGDMTETEQAKWIDDVFQKILTKDYVVGINYWVNVGGSTEIWDTDNKPRLAVKTITNYYKPHYMTGKIVNDVGLPINDVEVHSKYRTEYSKDGTYTIPLLDDDKIQFMKENYIAVTVNIDPKITTVFKKNVVMNASNQSLLYRFIKTVVAIFKSLWI